MWPSYPAPATRPWLSAELLRERLRAVVPRADRDAFLVEDGREVVRMNVLVPEADGTAPDADVLRSIDRDPGVEQDRPSRSQLWSTGRR